MAKTTGTERFFDFSAKGKFGQPWELGQIVLGQNFLGNEEKEINAHELGFYRLGKTELGQDDKRWGVYQKRKEKGKIFYIRENFMFPLNPRTETQQAWRGTFTDGMTAWGNLTDEQKLVYHKRAQKVRLHGVNLFLREYLNSHK